MIEVARAAYPELEFILADATNFSLPATFDAVFSNATLHWVIEAEKAIRCIATSLKTVRKSACLQRHCMLVCFGRTNKHRFHTRQ